MTQPYEEMIQLKAAHGVVIHVAVAGEPRGVWLEMKCPKLLGAGIMLTVDEAEQLVDALSRAATDPSLTYERS